MSKDFSDNFSFASSSLRTPNRNSFMINQDDLDFESEDQNSSLTEIFTTKNDLKVKYNAVRETTEIQKKKIEELKKKIDAMNEKGKEALQILDEKKDALTKEHDRLEALLNTLPTIDFLEEQSKVLSSIVEGKSLENQPTAFLDAKDLQEIGILNENESLAILQQRLKQVVNRLNELLELNSQQTLPFTFNENIQYDNSYESNEIKKKIKILRDMSPVSSSLAQIQCQKLEGEVSDLRDEIRKLKESQQSENLDPLINFDDVKNEVVAAGGEVTSLTCIRGYLYKYMTTLFRVEYRFKRLYAITDTIELPVAAFIKTLIPSKTVFSTPKRHKSLR